MFNYDFDDDYYDDYYYQGSYQYYYPSNDDTNRKIRRCKEMIVACLCILGIEIAMFICVVSMTTNNSINTAQQTHPAIEVVDTSSYN